MGVLNDVRRAGHHLGLVLVAVSMAACGGQPARHAAIVVPPVTPPDSSLRAPDGSRVPSGPLGRSILRGHAILAATGDSLPDHVGNALRCVSCHLDDGRRPGAMPLTGVYARFPQYRSRSGSVASIADRVNGCLQRSMNGTALAPDDPAMRDIVAYLAFISRGIAVGDSVPGEGLVKLDVTTADTAAGAQLFPQHCMRCHGADGGGTALAPPLWGPRSFNIGAGMARRNTAAAFIHANMPYDSAGVLTPQEAMDVGAYITSRPRPDFPGKEHDWPLGGAPPDVPYRTGVPR
jgi:thiosulfate dehydrogenase